MKALSSLLLALAICVATVIPSGAADDKQLKNMRGDVTYQQGTGAAKPVALNATVSLSNNDYANTGANSQATITLPDSSQVLIGQLTKIQMLAFDQQPGLATASFFLYQGKTRFAVKHPGGAKANYTFQTSTGQIAVRGTEGDISLDASTLQVNVYALGDPNLPVEVSLNNGKKYELHAGQALVVGVTGAIIAAAAVSSLSSTMTSTFAEFGPANAGAGAAGAGAAGAGAAGAAAGVAPAAIAAGAAAVAAGAVVAGASHNSPTPSKTPKPTPSPTNSPTPSPGDVVVNPSTIALTATGQTSTFTATQKHSGNSFTAVSDNPSAATVSPSSSTKTFTVTAAQGGTAHITVTGDDNKTAVVTVTAASGTIKPSTASIKIPKVGATTSFTVSEVGYAGSFTAASNNSAVAKIVSGGASARSAHDTTQTVTVQGVSSGTTTISVTDANGHTMSPQVNVAVVSGTIKLSASSIKFTSLKPQTFTASEDGFTGSFSASSGNTKVATVNGSSASLFTVTPVANGSATITVTDGLGNSNTLGVTVQTPTPATPTPTPSPSPAPSTTCVPIIINAKHHGPNAAATSCPTTAPTAAPTATPTPPSRVLRHPVGAQPPTGPPAKKPPVKPDPRHLPGNPMHPMQPLTGPQGMLTPPPLPVPPGGGSPP